MRLTFLSQGNQKEVYMKNITIKRILINSIISCLTISEGCTYNKNP
jgi:hypothetical protein